MQKRSHPFRSGNEEEGGEIKFFSHKNCKSQLQLMIDKMKSGIYSIKTKVIIHELAKLYLS
jgi:hypothetical protein